MGSLNNYLLLLLMGFKTHRRGKIMLFAEQNNDSRPRATGPVHVRTCDTFLFPPIKLMVLVRWLNPHVIAINFFYHSFYLSIFYIQVREKKIYSNLNWSLWIWFLNLMEKNVDKRERFEASTCKLMVLSN